MLELKNISFKRDDKNILTNINLKLVGNKFIVITGPNGSGKSSLVKIIMGIEKPDSGKILWNNIDITDMPIYERAKLDIAFAFQTPIKFKGITVRDLFKIVMNKDLDKKEECNILAKVGLCAKDYMEREINNSLSGGELKRIEIALVLAKKPKLAIFDEPEAGIDLWSFQRLITSFRELSEKTKGLTLVISHQERILNLADEVILIQNGKIVKTNNNLKGKSFFNKKCCIGETN
jgi:Fe-S cluster assembly ATP-binding protein